MASPQRPLSPHLQIYRPQLNSTLSILHRATGIVLALAAFALTWWLYAIAMGPDALQGFEAIANSLVGRLLVAATAFCACYHFFNGLRHLVWDTGRGLGLNSLAAAGWTVVVLSVLATLAICASGFGWIGGAA